MRPENREEPLKTLRRWYTQPPWRTTSQPENSNFSSISRCAQTFLNALRASQRYSSKVRSNNDSGGRDGGGSTEITALRGGSFVLVQSAGDGFAYPFGVWMSFSDSNFSHNFAATAFDAGTNALFFGADISPGTTTYSGLWLVTIRPRSTPSSLTVNRV